MKNSDPISFSHAVLIKLIPFSKNGSLRDQIICRFVCADSDECEQILDPTYDYVCPLIDYIGGVTHVFRDTNYSNRDDQYMLILKKVISFFSDEVVINSRPNNKLFDLPQLNSFGRISFLGLNLSKRKIKKLIEEGKRTEWDDPRLMTLRGLQASEFHLDYKHQNFI
jgi:glutamyl-tRNA synthetase